MTNGTGKALSRLNVTKARFARLLADISQVKLADAPSAEEFFEIESHVWSEAGEPSTRSAVFPGMASSRMYMTNLEDEL